MGIATLLVFTAAASAQPAATYTPSGKWTVEFADSMCVAIREYGTPEAPLTLLLKPLPGDSNIELMIGASRNLARKTKGETKVTLDPSGQNFAAYYYDAYAFKLRRHISRYYVQDIPLEALGKATAINFDTDQASRREFALTDMAQLRKVLDRCQDDLLRSWGADPAALAMIATRAKMVAGYVSDLDYPKGAANRGEQGTVALRWVVDPKGQPVGCTIVSSSESLELDSVSCALVSARFRYEPALDTSGKPVASWVSQRITWRLP